VGFVQRVLCGVCEIITETRDAWRKMGEGNLLAKSAEISSEIHRLESALAMTQ
jgi:hypothetical protein